MATYYKWRKSTAKKDKVLFKTVADGEYVPNNVPNGEGGRTLTYASGYLISGSDFEPQGDDRSYKYVKRGEDSRLSNNLYYIFTRSIDKTAAPYMYRAITSQTFVRLYGSSSTADLWCSEGSINVYKVGDIPGDFVGYVYSADPSAYPNGGVKDGYYYDQRSTVESPTAPTGLTCPNPIVTDSAAVSWTAAQSGTDYPVQSYEVSRSTDGGGSWTVVNAAVTGTNLTVEIPAGATVIRFRVRAKDSNGQWGGYVTGTDVKVIPAPTLTVPVMAMRGQPTAVSWSAVEGPDSYTLQRKADTDSDWVQVYSGAALTFTETAGSWTSVQYRVQAVAGGTPGGWAESVVIQVVTASALVISGKDGDLGTLTADVAYSISTDTGSAITAAVEVNGIRQADFSPKNGETYLVRVLDLPTGTGRIVVTASVTKSGAPLTVTRTWAYTKTAIPFETGRVDVMRLLDAGGTVQYPATVAEAVRLPGGKTLDQVTQYPAQVVTGSYVGTGTYGANNPNTLTFPFEPKIVFVSRADAIPSGTTGKFGIQLMLTRGCSMAITFLFSTSNSEPNAILSKITASWNGNTVSFYSTNSNYSKQGQLNGEGTNYNYVAIG